MYQHLYSHFLQQNSGKQHFACHSHHYWPDITRAAHLQYWDDSARLVDDKWDYLFTQVQPQTQRLIADILNTGMPEQLVFAPNTHELVFRILSCLPLDKPLKILTTDSEFHSFTRQINRLAENPQIQIIRIPTAPIDSFEQRFKAAMQADLDLVFVSQVFFNSGCAVKDLNGLVQAVPNPQTLVVVDGYHGFMALPTDLGAVAERIFYLAGSYKYAQGGEGACFAHVPKGCQLRPLYTGWFAEFGELDQAKSGQINYTTNGMRFAGSTMDFSAVYRLRAVLELFTEQGINVAQTHAYVQQCQQVFLTLLDALKHPQLHRTNLLAGDLTHHGHFLTFKLASEQQVKALASQLRQGGIYTDSRGDRLRFGFAIYHNPSDYDLSCLTNGV